LIRLTSRRGHPRCRDQKSQRHTDRRRGDRALKTIEIDDASSPLADYLEQARTEPLVFTDHGAPTAIILSLVNADLETVALSTNPEFIALIERSRARTQAEGGLSAAEMRRRVLPAADEVDQNSIGAGVVE
jgi:hypothetical protein